MYSDIRCGIFDPDSSRSVITMEALMHAGGDQAPPGSDSPAGGDQAPPGSDSPCEASKSEPAATRQDCEHDDSTDSSCESPQSDVEGLF
eukprot:4839845-Amphidinium_carterae.1